MEITVSMSVCNLFIIDFTEPIVCSDGSRVGENKTADRVCDSTVFFYSPVTELKIVIHYALVIESGRLHIPDFFSLLSVEDIRLCNILISSLREDTLYTVLYVFYSNLSIFDLRREV